MHDGARGGEVEADAARLERHDEDGNGRIRLKAVDHFGALEPRDAARQEVGAHARFGFDPVLKAKPHLRELREDEDLASRRAALVEDFKEGFGLAGVGRRWSRPFVEGG